MRGHILKEGSYETLRLAGPAACTKRRDDSPSTRTTPRRSYALDAFSGEGTLLYPDPLLSADEERLFREISPGVRIQTLSNWLEGRR